MPNCGFCNSKLPWGEGLVEDGVWFHESCYVRKIKKRLGLLEAKIKSGKITLDESNEGKELNNLLFNLMNNQKSPIIPNEKCIKKNSIFVFETKKMPAIFANPSIPILPYEETLKLETKTDKSLMKCKAKKQPNRRRKPLKREIRRKLIGGKVK